MRVKIGGPKSAEQLCCEYKDEGPGEDSFSLSHLTEKETQGDHFIEFRGSIVARIAARFESGFGAAGEYPHHPSSAATSHLDLPSCLKKQSSTSSRKALCSVSFSETPQIFSVERFNDSYFEIDFDDDDCHDEDESDSERNEAQSPIPSRRQALPDDMFTPEESSPPKSLASLACRMALPKPPLLDDDAPHSPMSVISLVLYGRQKLERDAAIVIQRMMRGWYQRLLYRVRWLQYQIDTHEERTRQDLERIQQEMRRRKDKLRKSMTRDVEKARKRELQTKTLARESQQIVAFLRKENNHLRDKIRELHQANSNLQTQNARIASANCQSDDVVDALKEHCANQQQAHERLLEAIPDYKASIELLTNALEERERYCMSETKIKISCRKTIALIVDKMNESLPDHDLTDEVMNLAIDVDDQRASCDSWAGEGSFSQMLDSWGRKSFSHMSRNSLANGLSESVAALHYESDSDDEDVKRYAHVRGVAEAVMVEEKQCS